MSFGQTAHSCVRARSSLVHPTYSQGDRVNLRKVIARVCT